VFLCIPNYRIGGGPAVPIRNNQSCAKPLLFCRLPLFVEPREQVFVDQTDQDVADLTDVSRSHLAGYPYGNRSFFHSLDHCTIDPARPINRSLAIGGAVDIRRVDRVAGFRSKVSTLIEVRSSVWLKALRTFSDDFARLSLNAAGAADRNQLL
jgi:hypothetical protein